MPVEASRFDIRPGSELAFRSRSIAQSDSLKLMTAAGQFQRQLPESSEAVIQEVFAHVLALGQNENFHPLAFEEMPQYTRMKLSLLI